MVLTAAGAAPGRAHPSARSTASLGRAAGRNGPPAAPRDAAKGRAAPRRWARGRRPLGTCGREEKKEKEEAVGVERWPPALTWAEAGSQRASPAAQEAGAARREREKEREREPPPGGRPGCGHGTGGSGPLPSAAFSSAGREVSREQNEEAVEKRFVCLCAVKQRLNLGSGGPSP